MTPDILALAKATLDRDSIERSARALCPYKKNRCPGEACGFCRNRAIAALEAYLNPTPPEATWTASEVANHREQAFDAGVALGLAARAVLAQEVTHADYGQLERAIFDVSGERVRPENLLAELAARGFEIRKIGKV